MSALLLGFEQSYQGLLRYLTRKLGCAETARELTHETWLRVAEAAPQWQDGVPAQQRDYLYTVARNLALDHLRRRSLGEDLLQPLDAERAPLPDSSGAADLERSLALRQAVQAVERALGGLPPRVRQSFLAHRLEGLEQAELALRHGVSVKTVERDIGQAMDAVHQALLHWRGEPRTPRRRRQALSGLLGLGGLALGGGLAWRLCSPSGGAAPEDSELLADAGPLLAQQPLRTSRGQLLEQRLPDGSELSLDADTDLHWRWHARLRQARLAHGSAYFAIQPDAQRPFLVQAGGYSVRVLGTAFAVEWDGRALQVAVAHGRVRVSDDRGGRRELQGGQRLRLHGGQSAGAAMLETLPTAQPVAPWRDGWLEFEQQPLSEVLARLARYLAMPLQWSDAAGRQQVSARVHLAHVQEWLRLLPDSHGLWLHPLPNSGWRLEKKT